jgi:hypothetical protein
MSMCCTALAEPFHLFVDWIKEDGDQWTLDGDLGDFVGDFIGGFGNADVPIWGGVNGVGTLSLPAVPEVPRGPFLDRIPVRSSCLVHLAIQCPCGLCPFAHRGLLSLFPTAPHGDESAIRSTPPLAFF